MLSLRKALRFTKRLGACCAGAALVEWTLVLPFLLALGLGIAEFGHALYQYQQIANGIRDAGRYLARLDDPIASLTQAQNLATRGTINTSGPLRVSYWDPEDVTATLIAEANDIDETTGESEYRGGTTINVVEVTTTVVYGDVGFLDFFGLGPITFSLRHQERVIGD